MSNHINAFCLSTDGKLVFAGDKSGRVIVINSDHFEIEQDKQVHLGTIQAMCSAPGRNLIATIGKDRAVSILRYDASGRIVPMAFHQTRDYTPDDAELLHHEGQAIALHPKLDRLVTTTGNSAVLEIDFSNPDNCYATWCVRADPENSIATVTYADKDVLVGSTRGAIIAIRDGKILRRITFPDISETFHWFEPMEDGSYLAACDARKVLHFRPDQDAAAGRWGPIIANDDFEHIVYDKINGRAYASSFDRNIYEISLASLAVKDIVWKADFKLRWIRLLPDQPNIMIAQVRDGSLLKIDIEKKALLSKIKLTPPAMWSFTNAGAFSYLAGEGSHYYALSSHGDWPADRIPMIDWKKRFLQTELSSYTKRIISHHESRQLYFARTTGEIWRASIDKEEDQGLLINLGSAVRDIALDVSGKILFSASEDGRISRIDAIHGKTIKETRHLEPIWALAYNPQRNWLAYGERLGRIRIVDATTLDLVAETFSRLPKRMRWMDDSKLLVTHSSRVDLIRYIDNEWQHEEGFLSGNDNTIEDFDWDSEKRYIVSVSYNKIISLYDYQTGKRLDTAYDGMDYMKGISFLKNLSRWGGDFATFGRSGYLKLYRIHDEQIIGLDKSLPNDFGFKTMKPALMKESICK